jgi:hypothetical protein
MRRQRFAHRRGSGLAHDRSQGNRACGPSTWTSTHSVIKRSSCPASPACGPQPSRRRASSSTTATYETLAREYRASSLRGSRRRPALTVALRGTAVGAGGGSLLLTGELAAANAIIDSWSNSQGFARRLTRSSRTTAQTSSLVSRIDSCLSAAALSKGSTLQANSLESHETVDVGGTPEPRRRRSAKRGPYSPAAITATTRSRR